MSGRIVPRRFLDVEEEPDRFFPGIQGFETCPLVSLRKAIEPIKSLLHNVDSMIEIVEQNCQKPLNKLSSDESGAIYLYTMQWPQPHLSLSILLNERLRSKNRTGLISFFLFLKLFFTALCKLPSFRGTIWRSSRGNLCDHYNVDHVWWGMSSCIESFNIAEKNLGTNEIRTIFNIECLSGKSIQFHSSFKDENEILLLPGSYFQVIAKWQAGKDLFMIQLREKNSSFQSIHSLLDLPSPIPDKVLFPNEKKNLSNGNSALIKSSEQNQKWKPKGTIIIGDYGKGERLDQLSRFEGISMDENKNVFIADTENHRVIQLKYRSNTGQTICDANFKRNINERLNNPINVIFNKHNNSFIISDRGNQRVIRCYGRYKENQEILFKNIDCWGLALDKHGNLYVTDYEKSEIRKWKKGSNYGIVVAGGNGNGKKLNQLSGPTYIFVDDKDSIYISDTFNHRIMKWEKNSKEGICVAGGNDSGDEPEQLFHPKGLFVDQFNQIFISDWGNNRIMRWIEGDTKGSIVIGGNGNGKELNQLTYPTGLTLDQDRNIYVADSLNFRILKYQIDSD